MNDASSVRPDLGVGADDEALQVAPAGAAADGVVDPHEAVAELVDAVGGLDVRAVGDVLAVDVQVAPPLAVPVAVEPEVEAGAEVEAGVAHRRDGDRPRRSVGHRAGELGAEQPAVVVAHRERGHERGERLAAAVGVLDAALQLDPLPAAERVALVVEVDPVAAAVGSLAQHRRPDDDRLHARRPGCVRHVVERRAHHVAHAPRVVAGGHRRRCRRARDARRRPRPSPSRSRSGGSGRCRRRGAARRGCGAARAARGAGGTTPVKVHSNDDRHDVVGIEGEAHRAQRLEDLVADRARPPSLDARARARRLDRTVHCSTPRLTPAYASSTPRFGYLPMPKASWKAPSLGAAIAQTFSVHDRSDWATVAKVWVIWWVKVSSAGATPQGPPRVVSRRPQHRAAMEATARAGRSIDEPMRASPQTIDS